MTNYQRNHYHYDFSQPTWLYALFVLAFLCLFIGAQMLDHKDSTDELRDIAADKAEIVQSARQHGKQGDDQKRRQRPAGGMDIPGPVRAHRQARRPDAEVVAQARQFQGRTGNWHRPRHSSSPSMRFMFCTA